MGSSKTQSTVEDQYFDALSGRTDIDCQRSKVDVTFYGRSVCHAVTLLRDINIGRQSFSLMYTSSYKFDSGQREKLCNQSIIPFSLFPERHVTRSVVRYPFRFGDSIEQGSDNEVL